MTEYKPGTVAEIGWQMTSGKERAMFDGWYWHTESGVTVRTPESVRPLVVLDLDRYVTPELLTTWLQQNAVCGSYSVASEIADQIEAQTKPPRIPEPGKYGVVKASGQGLDDVEWVNEGKWWVSIDEGISPHRRWAEWRDLLDPILIREGVSE